MAARRALTPSDFAENGDAPFLPHYGGWLTPELGISALERLLEGGRFIVVDRQTETEHPERAPNGAETAKLPIYFVNRGTLRPTAAGDLLTALVSAAGLMPAKDCLSCNEEKPLSAFSPIYSRGRGDELRAHCNVCRALMERARRAKRKARLEAAKNPSVN